MNVIVVIPARDEEELIGPCLDSVIAAATPATRILVVADGCVDGTAEVARSRGVEVLELGGRSVGAARR